MTYGNAPREIIDFNAWLGRQPHRHKLSLRETMIACSSRTPCQLAPSSQMASIWRTLGSKWKA
jgi:hypothetical protein